MGQERFYPSLLSAQWIPFSLPHRDRATAGKHGGERKGESKDMKGLQWGHVKPHSKKGWGSPSISKCLYNLCAGHKLGSPQSSCSITSMLRVSFFVCVVKMLKHLG